MNGTRNAAEHRLGWVALTVLAVGQRVVGEWIAADHATLRPAAVTPRSEAGP